MGSATPGLVDLRRVIKMVLTESEEQASVQYSFIVSASAPASRYLPCLISLASFSDDL